MSDKNTGVAPPVPHPHEDEPPAHVDTPAQAAARQLIETSPRTTHVHIEPELPEPPAKDEKEDLSLEALVPKKDKAKASADTFTVTKTSETTAHVTKGKS